MSLPAAVVIVPGAWHGPWAYQSTVDGLLKAGIEATCVDLPSIAPPDSGPRAGLAEDIKAVQAAIDKYVSQGKEVVVAPHSYGGVPAAQACMGLGLEGRAKKGEKGGVKRLIYIAAFMIPPHVSLLQALGGKHLEWFDQQGDLMYYKVPMLKEVFYGDISQDEADACIAKLQPTTYSVFVSPTTDVAWLSLPTSFVRCGEDKALLPFVQDMMIKGANLDEEKGDVVRLNTSHSPFLSEPGRVVEILEKAARA